WKTSGRKINRKSAWRKTRIWNGSTNEPAGAGRRRFDRDKDTPSVSRRNSCERLKGWFLFFKWGTLQKPGFPSPSEAPPATGEFPSGTFPPFLETHPRRSPHIRIFPAVADRIVFDRPKSHLGPEGIGTATGVGLHRKSEALGVANQGAPVPLPPVLGQRFQFPQLVIVLGGIEIAVVFGVDPVQADPGHQVSVLVNPVKGGVAVILDDVGFQVF